MKFDVIIGNPPYQLNVGNTGANNAVATALYHHFVDKAIELRPRYITMIIPSRWMSANPKGIPKDWIKKMIDDKRIKEVHDFMNSEDCFQNVMIRGGVNYFLWDSDYEGKCKFNQHTKEGAVKTNVDYLNSKESGIVIRDVPSLGIVERVLDIEGNYLNKNEKNFSSMVGPGAYFVSGKKMKSNWKDFSRIKTKDNYIKYYTSSLLTGSNVGWVRYQDVERSKDALKMHKVYVNAVGENEKFGRVIAEPFYGEPESVCSMTYSVIGYDKKKHNFNKEECLNIISYMKTKFFRFMVDVKKSTQSCSRSVYQFAPLQDFSKSWTDEELYKKYKLTQEEIDYIENNIDEMT